MPPVSTSICKVPKYGRRGPHARRPPPSRLGRPARTRSRAARPRPAPRPPRRAASRTSRLAHRHGAARRRALHLPVEVHFVRQRQLARHETQRGVRQQRGKRIRFEAEAGEVARRRAHRHAARPRRRHRLEEMVQQRLVGAVQARLGTAARQTASASRRAASSRTARPRRAWRDAARSGPAARPACAESWYPTAGSCTVSRRAGGPSAGLRASRRCGRF